MSRGLLCDECDAVLPVKRNGDDDNGESTAWVHISVASMEFDCCTRACACELLNREDVVEAVDAQMAAVGEIVQAIRESREGESSP